MASTVKTAIIFVAIGVILILVYVYFIKADPEADGLLSSATSTPALSTSTASPETALAQDFLSLLLNVKNIKLNDTLFSDVTFTSLRDSSITLIPDGTEGRPNPFAALGSDNVPAAASLAPVVVPASNPPAASSPTGQKPPTTP